MKLTKLTLAMLTALMASASFEAAAIDLYVDTTTEQLFAKPGPGRVLMGSFEKTGSAPTANNAIAASTAIELKAIREDLAVKTKDLADKTKEIKSLSEQAAVAAKPDAVKVSLKDGLKFETNDGNFTTEIHGRVQVDSQENVNQQLHNSFLTPGGTPAALDNSVGLRRARLSMEGTIYKNADYKLEYDFTRGTTIAGGITDAWARYNFSKPLSVKIGSFKEPLTLEDTTSDIQTSFIERSMAVNAFVDNLNVFKVGIGANYSAERWLVATGLQTQGPGSFNSTTLLDSPSANNQSATGNTQWELNGRIAGTPWMASPTQLVHVGGWGSYTSVNNNLNGNGTVGNGGVAFGSALGSNMDRTAVLTTGNLSSTTVGGNIATAYNRFGAETAVVLGPFSAQAEFLQTNVSGNGYSNNALTGYYGYMTYFLTGESRNYVTRTGAFDRVKPKHNVDMNGGMGAWELLAGFDELNLRSGDKINGGVADLGKLGVNWYFNPRIRLMTNYVHVFNINSTGVTNNTTTPAFNNAKLDMVESRVQLDW